MFAGEKTASEDLKGNATEPFGGKKTTCLCLHRGEGYPVDACVQVGLELFKLLLQCVSFQLQRLSQLRLLVCFNLKSRHLWANKHRNKQTNTERLQCERKDRAKGKT